MMVKRGYFGIGIWHGKHDCNQGTMWRSAYSFGADFVFTVGARFKRQASDTTKAWCHVPMLHFADMDDLISHLPYSCPIAGVELTEDSFDLKTFIHPDRCVYLLGAEDHGLSGSILDQCHLRVQIAPTKVCLNVSTAGSIVMWDRVSKRGVSERKAA